MKILKSIVLSLSVFLLTSPAKACDQETLNFAMQSIHSYVNVHPAAADTLEGIHHYWIVWGDPQPALDCTHLALVSLESYGIIERVAVGNREVWRKARD